MKNDKFLISIVITIVLLMLLATGVFLTRQNSQDYIAEDSPEGVVHNFVFAIQNDEYERAYGYLSDQEGKPSYSDFQKWFRNDSHNDNGVQIQGSEVFQGDDTVQNALVDIRITQYSSEPFNNSYRMNGVVELKMQEGNWKIFSFPDRFWSWEWYRLD